MTSSVRQSHGMPHDLAARIAQFDACVQDRDVALATTVLDDDYALVVSLPAPATVPRARWLHVLPDYVVHSYAVETCHVDEDGDTAAVLQTVQMRATVLGEDRSGRFVLSDVWRKRDGEWRIWRRHSTPFTADHLPGLTS